MPNLTAKTYFGASDKVSEMCYLATSAGGETIDVGNEELASISYTAANIDGNITAVTDITDPAATGGWTDLASITDNIKAQIRSPTGSLAIIRVNLAEDSGDSLRLQMLRDDIVILDVTVVGDNANTMYLAWSPVVAGGDDGTNYYSEPIVCQESFLIRAARKGNFTNADSYIKIGAVTYEVLS